MKKYAVWFDRPSDCICFADRGDREKEGEPIPKEKVVKIPLADAEDFLEEVFAAAVSEPMSFFLDAVQAILDSRAAQAISLSERLRLERIKRSEGIVGRNRNQVLVRADRHIRLEELRSRFFAVFGGLPEDSDGGDEGKIVSSMFDLHEWAKKADLDEPGQVSGPESGQAEDQPGPGA